MTQPSIVTKKSLKEAQPSGILACQSIRAMIAAGEIASAEPSLAFEPDQIQPASLDLRLGHFAYPMDKSFIPGRGMTVERKMALLDGEYERFAIPLKDGAVLERNRIYIVPLLEQLDLAGGIQGFANPKSSTGRLDILTRLICDGGTTFDEVPADYSGPLYLEIAPRSFSVVLRTGTRLNQLRFRCAGGTGEGMGEAEWQALLAGQIVDLDDDTRYLGDERGKLRFTVDLRGAGEDGAIIGWRARKHTTRIDLDRRDYHPLDYWEPLRFNRDAMLTLDPNEFYILMTRESVAVPPGYAAEMIPYDTRAGEFRVHYAGFFDPGFGWDAKTGKIGASKGVLEVRSHEVPFLLEHGQPLGWLRYEKMAQMPDMLYGQEIQSNYQGQGLKLAKQFRAV